MRPYREPAKRDDTAFDQPAGLLSRHERVASEARKFMDQNPELLARLGRRRRSRVHPTLLMFLGILGLGVLVSMVMR